MYDIKYADTEDKVLDQLVSVAVVNLYTLCKDKKLVRLSHFDFEDEGHLTLLSIGYIMKNLYGYKIEVCATWWDYFRYNFKLKYMKWCSRAHLEDEGINTKEFIRHIEDANNMRGIFRTIYERYYKK